ncbi:MAG: DivIVA domain-containing protein [Acidimicrobiaceae bacterium]|nr:DivIVA domain-containing protein [Acidimicrobiaceae bacterium]
MAISFSRPDPSSPTAVSTANFSTSRRGYEPDEVREFLRMVAAELARLQEREKFLERELRVAQRNVPNAAVVLDEEVVTRMLGEEAARILSTAREAASQIKMRAEDGASRVLREATDEAQRLREEAEIEASRRRQDASSDAESELQMAKQQGREMVNEARAYRERVLGELARRRELARQQIEQLVHGRDRLLNAFERARLAAVDVMAEMTPLGEPNEYVNLSPTTGPVPLMVPANDVRARQVPTEADQPDREPYDADADVDLTDEVDEVDDPTVALQIDDTVVLLREPAAHDDDNDEHIEADGHADDDADDDAEDDSDGVMATVVSLFAGEIDVDIDVADPDVVDVVDIDAEEVDASDEVDATDEVGDGEEKASVGDLFARLRAARSQPEPVVAEPLVAEPVDVPAAEAAVEPASDGSEPPPDAATTAVAEELSVFAVSPAAPLELREADDSPFGRRDAALTPLIVAAARKLKRVLADEQNDVLHILRRNDPVAALAALLPQEADHSRRYATAIESELRLSALAGAASIDDGDKGDHLHEITRAKALQPAIEALSVAVVGPLRERLSRAVADADGDNGELANTVRSVYREWKTQRIDEHLDDVARMAFGRGALVALAPGTPVCWSVDPNGPACPDAEDNALAGVIGAGQAFPTDHTCAPAHEGCRCMLQRAPL